jgi:hypothetical protein
MEKLKLNIDDISKELAIAGIILRHGNYNYGEYWLLDDKSSLATMDHMKKIFPLGGWSRDSENCLWFTLKEENHE